MSDREKSKKVGPKKRKQQFSSTSSDDSDAKQSSKMAEKKTKMGFEQKLQMRIADHLRKNTQKVISQSFFFKNTQFEIFIFCPKIQLWFPKKIVDFFGVKNSWKFCGFRLLNCWQLWFHEKNCQKKIGWKTRENVGVLSKLNFWTNFGNFRYFWN